MKKTILKAKFSGFTLIELLVVIVIIGLLTTLAMVALKNAQQKTADAKRVAEIKSVQTALELYFNDNKKYPGTSGGSVYFGNQNNTYCLGTAGFAYGATATACISDPKSYMKMMPHNLNTQSGYLYWYVSDAANWYGIYLHIDTNVSSLPAGQWWATPKGFRPYTGSMSWQE